MIAPPRIGYLDGVTYHDATRNPAHAEPDRDLRQLFANNRALPLEILQVLVGQGATTLQNFAFTLGDSVTEVRTFLNSDPNMH